VQAHSEIGRLPGGKPSKTDFHTPFTSLYGSQLHLHAVYGDSAPYCHLRRPYKSSRRQSTTVRLGCWVCNSSRSRSWTEMTDTWLVSGWPTGESTPEEVWPSHVHIHRVHGDPDVAMPMHRHA
jgi:hypothetical protein